MSNIGFVTVPAPVSSGLTWPLVSDYGYGFTQETPTVSHRFGENATLSYQTFQTGIGPKKFVFKRDTLKYGDRNTLQSFWEAVQGSFQTFIYSVPSADRTSFTNYTVIFENAPLSLTELVNKTQTGITFVECPNSPPTYTIASTDTRFPSDTLATALTEQTQVIIPLVHIVSRTPSCPDIYLSDRLCTVGSNIYQPRLLDMGEAGSGVVMTQSMNATGQGGSADQLNFSFNNADRVMTQVMNSCDLKYAEIDLCLYHVNSGILLQLWKGFIINYQSDGTPVFKVQATDGIYQISQQYPIRTVSRSCWKTFDDGVNCPFTTQGGHLNTDFPMASSTSCDKTWDGVNGCQAHSEGLISSGSTNMTLYFGGHPVAPQGVLIKDDSTGLWGIGRSKVTATSIVSDTVFGNALPEIWCNQGDSGLNAYITNAMVCDVRDEDTYFDCLGIVGAGPIYAYTIDTNSAGTGSSGEIITNADGLPVLIAPLADGFTAQGFKFNASGTAPSTNKQLGLRQVVGNDPIPAGDQGYEQFGLTPASVVGIPFAAGTAFLELRYQKPSSIAPTTPDQHSMTVPIAQGLTGWKFDNLGNPTAQGGLTNPFWIAVNSYFRALGIHDPQGLATNTDSLTAEQLESFVLSSLFVGDGSGTAEIADLSVPSLIDSTTMETQFQFQGVLAQQKPFRDWLSEILSCALGYYTFEFGKLKLGIRENASAVSAFTQGNMLYQSLSLAPINAAYEHLICNFADVEYQYQNNTADYQDFDHAAYYGRPGCPLTQTMHSVGMSTLSQALRVVATMTREEVGGIQALEWNSARKATWKTTILALDTEPGQVVEISHPDLPGGSGATATAVASSSTNINVTITNGGTYGIVPEAVLTGGSGTYDYATVTVTDAGVVTGVTITGATGYTIGDTPTVAFFSNNKFRIKSWSLMKDWSVQITAQTVTDSMYALDYGPKPNDVAAPPLPVLYQGIPLGEWAPFQLQAQSTDFLYPSEYTFDANQEYTTLADGTQNATIVCTGVLPVNSFIAEAGSPIIQGGAVTQTTTGGTLPGGIMLRVAVCGTNNSGQACTPASNVIYVQIPSGTNTNTITITDIVWPPIAGLTGYCLFASQYDDLICFQQSGTLTAGTVVGTITPYTPTSITYDGPLQRSTWALPNIRIDHVELKGTLLIHGGVQGSRVDSISGNTITCGESVDVANIDNWTGRYIIPIGRMNSAQPFVTFKCTAFDPTTGTFTLDRAVTDAGHPEWSIVVGDAIVVCFLGYDNSGSPTVFTDAGISNSQDEPTPHTGEYTNDRIGDMMRCIAGTNRGATAMIVSNGATSYTLDRPFVLDATSVVVVEDPSWEYFANAPSVTNINPLVPSGITMNVSNYLAESMLIGSFIVDKSGNVSGEGDALYRMVYVFGAPINLTASYTEVDRATFGVGIGAPQPVANDITNHYMVRQAGTIYEALGNCKTPMISGASPLTFDILKSSDQGGSWFSVFGGTQLVIPANSTLQVTQTTFSTSHNVVAPGDWLRIDLMTGSNAGSMNIEVVCKWGNPASIILS